MINRYFKRRFKTVAGVKFAIFLKRPYDWIRLKWKGEEILSHRYTFFNNGAVCKITNGNGKVLNPDGYTITNMIVTKSMQEDLLNMKGFNPTEELENILKNENNN